MDKPLQSTSKWDEIFWFFSFTIFLKFTNLFTQNNGIYKKFVSKDTKINFPLDIDIFLRYFLTFQRSLIILILQSHLISS
jgi:hypothetical protein